MNTVLAFLLRISYDLKHRDEAGATAVEYGLLVGLIAVAIILAVTTLGTTLRDLFNNISGQLP
jgi:pilus assembly protein Flp/PilA